MNAGILERGGLFSQARAEGHRPVAAQVPPRSLVFAHPGCSFGDSDIARLALFQVLSRAREAFPAKRPKRPPKLSTSNLSSVQAEAARRSSPGALAWLRFMESGLASQTCASTVTCQSLRQSDTEMSWDMMTSSGGGGGGGGVRNRWATYFWIWGGGGEVTTVPTQHLLRIFCSLVGNVGNLHRNRWQQGRVVGIVEQGTYEPWGDPLSLYPFRPGYCGSIQKSY